MPLSGGGARATLDHTSSIPPPRSAPATGYALSRLTSTLTREHERGDQQEHRNQIRDNAANLSSPHVDDEGPDEQPRRERKQEDNDRLLSEMIIGDKQSVKGNASARQERNNGEPVASRCGNHRT